MTALQYRTIILTAAICALDGFDIVSISFAAAGITSEWKLSLATLGLVLSMEMIGMAIGSLALGAVSDRIGRRKTALTCLTILFVGMLATAFANNVGTLMFWRILTGIGIGGMFPAVNSLVAENTNERQRGFYIGLVAMGGPFGAIVGGLLVSAFAGGEWRNVFFMGAGFAALLLPLSALYLRETVAFLSTLPTAQALKRVNEELVRMGREPVDSLPEPKRAEESKAQEQPRWGGIYREVLLWKLGGGYFFLILAYYFLIKWGSKVAVDLGFSPGTSTNVLVVASIGGVAGGILLGFTLRFFSAKWLTIAALGLFSAGLITIGLVGANATVFLGLSFLIGFFGNGAIVGFYNLFPEYFAADVRGAGSGAAMAVGRGGAILSPIFVGSLFERGASLTMVTLIMGATALVAIALLTTLPARKA